MNAGHFRAGGERSTRSDLAERTQSGRTNLRFGKTNPTAVTDPIITEIDRYPVPVDDEYPVFDGNRKLGANSGTAKRPSSRCRVALWS
jgi:hypothetical protein